MQACSQVVVLGAGLDIRISVLPQRSGVAFPSLWAPAGEIAQNELHVPIEVVEGEEYRYEAIGNLSTAYLLIQPEELFQPDDQTGKSGRLRPGLATGLVEVKVFIGDQNPLSLDLEVRSKKLSYRSEYRWMLRDIAYQMTEVVMERFAPAAGLFEPDPTREAVTSYERLAFLKSLLASESLRASLTDIVHRPHSGWSDDLEEAPVQLAARGGSHLIRELSRRGQRLPGVGVISSIPARISRRLTIPTRDTEANRFVKFALESWLGLVNQVGEWVERKPPRSPSERRALQELSALRSELEEWLAAPLFAEVGTLTHFPVANQVLSKRAGYREIFRSYVQLQFAATLVWHTPDSYRAGQRDVAALYEYWAFIQLASVIAQLVGYRFDLSPMLRVTRDGLGVTLRQGEECAVTGEVERFGRVIGIELVFNRTFPAKTTHGSWTRPMRPDATLTLTRVSESAEEPTRIHFDAKYRVQALKELFGDESELVDNSSAQSSAKRDDLLKMHAYRDAIRQSSGAYVLYPGKDETYGRETFKEFRELLPGLGAFVLRPTEVGEAVGVAGLRRFIAELLDQVALRLSEQERAERWLSEVHGKLRSTGGEVTHPSGQTSVLFGFVKSAAHWHWIHSRRTYNLRTSERAGGVQGDAALLQCQLLCLYCPATGKVGLARIVADPERVPCAAMRQAEYPDPHGDYWCVQISIVDRPEWLQGIEATRLEHMGVSKTGLRGAPFAATWDFLAECLDR